MILGILLSNNKSKSLSESDCSVIYIGVFMRSLSEDSSDKYISNIIDIFSRYKY